MLESSLPVTKNRIVTIVEMMGWKPSYISLPFGNYQIMYGPLLLAKDASPKWTKVEDTALLEEFFPDLYHVEVKTLLVWHILNWATHKDRPFGKLLRYDLHAPEWDGRYWYELPAGDFIEMLLNRIIELSIKYEELE